MSLLMAQLRQQGPALFQLTVSTVKLFYVLYKKKDRNVSSPSKFSQWQAAVSHSREISNRGSSLTYTH